MFHSECMLAVSSQLMVFECIVEALPLLETVRLLPNIMVEPYLITM